MILGKKRLSQGDRPVRAERARVVIPQGIGTIYAIGDVHGCLDELVRLEQMIASDSTAPAGEKLIVMLGDYVDRGPSSAGVIDHLLRPMVKGFTRITLAGNHEELMLNAIMGRADEAWLEFGGVETLRSYGVSFDSYRASGAGARHKMLAGLIPQEHLSFLQSLPISLQVEQTVFVHAGIRRDVPLERQVASDLMWIRREFLDAAPTDGLLVVHGHTPTETPEVLPGRIGIDTGAFATGRLTAVRLVSGQAPVFFTTHR